MKLVTWNVNSLEVRLPRVLELLEAMAERIRELGLRIDAFLVSAGLAVPG